MRSCFPLSLGILLVGAASLCHALASPGSLSPQNETHIPRHPEVPHEFVYVNCNCGVIQQFRVGNDGGLVPLTPVGVRTAGPGAYLYVGPDGRHLYTPNYDNNAVSQYRINPDGTLEPLTPPFAPAGNFNLNLAFSHDGRTAYSTNITSNTISQYRVGSDGTLNPMRRAEVPAGVLLDGLCIPPHRHFAYAPDRGDIHQFAIHPDGSLHPLSPTLIPIGKEVRNIIFDTSGRFAYALCHNDATIRQFRIGVDGQLDALSPAAVPLPGSAFFARGDVPPGRLYAVVSGAGISQFRIAADGRLFPLTGKPFVTAKAEQLTFSPSGRYAYSTENSEGTLRAFTISPDGSLSALGQPFTLARPGQPVVVPSGRFVYVPEFDTKSIDQFRVNPDGILSPLNPPSVGLLGHPSTLTALHLTPKKGQP